VKVLGCTSIRSDYDLLSPLYDLLRDDKDIVFKLVVSGAHLSEYHGKTISQIESDRFDILCKLNTIKSKDDSKASRLKSASILLTEIIDPIEAYQPELLLFSGDREDVLVYSMVGTYLGIPTIHFYSGDHAKDGYVDNPIRHATSKLSTAHFVCLEEHAKRLIAMGELKGRIYKIGSISLDRFYNFKAEPLEYVQKELSKAGKKLRDRYCLMIFHPLGEEIEDTAIKFKYTLDVLESLGIQAVVSYPNTDPNNKKIRKVISEYKENSNIILYENLERNLFLSVFKHSLFIIGNSSAGIYEAASIPLAALNIGERQKGRLAGDNVLFVSGNNEDEIKHAVLEITGDEFQKVVKDVRNPYGNGESAVEAYKLIKKINFSELILKTEDALEVKDE
jgi:UDP-N-acetylglucosamine 2-epimerase (non-hydrolysing)/GDP/UDP-N,N'-diacetylbacillosamine 2-epimerase (hydrolysing)